jgi:hypothetical protein
MIDGHANGNVHHIIRIHNIEVWIPQTFSRFSALAVKNVVLIHGIDLIVIATFLGK